MEIVNNTKGQVVEKPEIKEYTQGKYLQTFVLRTEEAYPRMLEFTLFQKGIDAHGDKINEGTPLAIKFNIDSRDHNGRYYYTLKPWSIEVLNDQASESQESGVTIEENNSDQDALEDEDNPF